MTLDVFTAITNGNVKADTRVFIQQNIAHLTLYLYNHDFSFFHTGWKILFHHCWKSAESMLKLKNTYAFRIVSVLKFLVSASFTMQNPTVSQIPDGFSRLTLIKNWRFQIVSACMFSQLKLEILQINSVHMASHVYILILVRVATISSYVITVL